jgi:hypothetical protein|tara:strand:+ start:82123 stop:82302 length:180 start_codon:yes stop_codon:yes gene_type:complete
MLKIFGIGRRNKTPTTDAVAELALDIGSVASLTGHSGSGQIEDGGSITNYTRKDPGTSG